MEYIKQTYGVPAEVGGRVRYTGGKVSCEGTIKGSCNASLEILLDGDDMSGVYHPTWELEYL